MGGALALSWNVLVLGVYAITCLVEGVPFSANIEVDSWLGFYACYAMKSRKELTIHY